MKPTYDSYKGKWKVKGLDGSIVPPMLGEKSNERN